jgi:hypothetical protein
MSSDQAAPHPHRAAMQRHKALINISKIEYLRVGTVFDTGATIN